MICQEEKTKVSLFLRKILDEQLDAKEREWISLQEERLRSNFAWRTFYLVFSSASRFIRKHTLELSQKQLIEANIIQKGFEPKYWDLLQCVRSYLLLLLPEEDENNYVSNLTKLHETADIDEQVALYNTLSFLSYPKKMRKRCAEGLRTNITDVFDAIALNNPYPADFLDQDAWNQMILKAVFMQRPLYRINGVGARANPELARMLIDFAHERWAAKRPVSPELWRLVGPFMGKNDIINIQKVIKGEPLEVQAGILACSMSELSEAKDLLNQFSDIKKDIEKDRLNWKIIGRKRENDHLN